MSTGHTLRSVPPHLHPHTLIALWSAWLLARDLSPQTIRLRTYQLARFAESHPQLLSAGHVGVLMARALPGKLTAHTLRHAFATKVYRNTLDLLAVQELLGHASPETTRHYVQLPEDSLRRAVESAA